MLRRRNRHNAVHLELADERPGDTPENNRYTRAGALFRRWLDESILVREASPAIFVVDEEFAFNGTRWRRRGLTALVRLEEYDKGIVIPHEHTTPAVRAYRLALMEAARANFSPIMSLYRDSDDRLDGLIDAARRAEPTLTTHLDGLSSYEMRTITDRRLVSEMSQAMASCKIFIADGHHRYEAALRYRDELDAATGGLSPNAAARYVMMTLIPFDDMGLLVLPFHRLVGGLRDGDLAALKRGLDQAFEIEVMRGVPAASPEGAARAIESRLAVRPLDEMVLAVVGLEPGETHLLTLREERRPVGGRPPCEQCDVWLLHQMAIRPALGADVEAASVSFVHDAAEAVASVRRGEKQITFLLRSLPMAQFAEVVETGQRLPPKSTCFSPKLPTGLVFNSLLGEI